MKIVKCVLSLTVFFLLILSCDNKLKLLAETEDISTLEKYKGAETIIKIGNESIYDLVQDKSLFPISDLFVKSLRFKDKYWVKRPLNNEVNLSSLSHLQNKDITKEIQTVLDFYTGKGVKSFSFPEGKYFVETINVRPGMALRGNETTLTRIPNQPKFSRMFTTSKFKHSGDLDTSESLSFQGFTLDGNLKSQGEYKKYQLEQQALIFLSADNKKSGKQKVIIRDCKFLNNAGDGIHVYTNVDVEIYNCEAVNVFRGGITITGGHSKIRVKAFKAYGDLHATGIDIEVDGKGFNDTYEVDIVMENVDLQGDCDIGIRKGTFIGKNIICHNAPYHFLATNGEISIYDSHFVGGSLKESVIKFPKNVKFENCTFSIKDTKFKENFGANIYWTTNSYSGSNQQLTFKNCEFKLLSENKSKNNTYGIFTRADMRERNNILNIIDCTFSGPWNYSYYMRQGGNVNINNISQSSNNKMRFASVNNKKYKHNYNVQLKEVKSEGIVDIEITENKNNVLKFIKTKNVNFLRKSTKGKSKTILYDK